MAIAFLAGALALLLPFYWFRNLTQTVAPEKSIAVLPFENLSGGKQDPYLADGLQDEILSDLARVADLKVISRTSTMQYKRGLARNLREIGRQLGVANVVEGTVARSGNRVRVNAQLIDARTDHHVWGQAYDRELPDVFAIQKEIAKTIAKQLQAKLSPAEKNAIDQVPTNDVTAFDLYTRAKNLLVGITLSSSERTDALQAVDLLNEGVALDPSFFQAYCQLAYAHEALYYNGADHTPRVWPWLKQLFKPQFGFTRMLVKRILRAHGIFIGDTLITPALSLNSKLPIRPCLTILRFSS